MTTDRAAVEKIARQALSGRGAHVETVSALEQLDWELVGSRPAGVPHSIFQLVNHMIYWQDFSLRWLDGRKPATPEHASDSWPGSESPKTAEEWGQAVDQFRAGLEELNRRAKESDLFCDIGKKTALEILQLIASHNSYHVGQVALLRRMLGAWPPPGGGATW